MHISTQQDGGAGRAARRLHDGLRRIGQDSLLFLRDAPEAGPAAQNTVFFDARAGLWTRARRQLRRKRIERDFAPYRAGRSPGQELFSDDRSVLRAELRRQIPPSDLLHLHWVAGFVDYADFLAHVPPHTPVVWTLHDMNAFTGGCHYDAGCGRFAAQCGACPELASSADHDLSRHIWSRKRSALARVPRGRLRLVADSEWLAAEARKSALFRELPVAAIHYALDVEVFAPRGRAAAREVLGIPSAAAVVLFAADHPAIKRKGFADLAEALAGLACGREIFLLSMGRTRPELSPRYPQLYVGHVTEERLQAIVYSAADLFVIPSRQEAFGQTALEAMACGVPVVGSDAGGIPEIVRDRQTGLVVPAGDARALREAVESLLGAPARLAEMAAECRRVAVAEYALEVQARRYAALYQEMLGAALASAPVPGDLSAPASENLRQAGTKS